MERFLLHVANIIHLISFIVIILQIKKNKESVSVITQLLYMIIFCIRYTDIIHTSYLIHVKLIYISLSSYILYCLYCPILMYDIRSFTFKYGWMFIISLLGTTIIYCDMRGDWTTWMDIVWSYSIWIESMVLVPQITHTIDVLYDNGNDFSQEILIFVYMGMIITYKILYCVGWMVKWKNDDLSFNQSLFLLSVVRSCLLMDVVYGYVRYRVIGNMRKRKLHNKFKDHIIIS